MGYSWWLQNPSWNVSSVPSSCTSNPASSWCIWVGNRWQFKCQGPRIPCGRYTWSLLFLTLVWTRPAYCSHLNQQMENLYFFLSPFLSLSFSPPHTFTFQINKWIIKKKTFQIFYSSIIQPANKLVYFPKFFLKHTLLPYLFIFLSAYLGQFGRL